jgi:hypothetical protein
MTHILASYFMTTRLELDKTPNTARLEIFVSEKGGKHKMKYTDTSMCILATALTSRFAEAVLHRKQPLQ